MTTDHAARSLAAAITSRDEARRAFTAARVGTKAWRMAEEDLNFWQGKVANLEALVMAR